ncbi:MAG: Ig-like domain-containing protein [Candidatus Dormibacteria bacterium]
MHKSLITGSAALAAISAMFVSVPALAYGPTQGNSTGSVSAGSTGPGGTVTFTGTFQDANGQGVAGATVTFSQQSGPGTCKASFSPVTATTDSSGKASTTVTLPAGCAGQYVLAAATAGATVTATVSETGGFPATSADVPGAPAGNPLPVLALVLGLALVAIGGGAFALKRR